MPTSEITAAGRYIILAAAFLGWMFSGFQMAVMTLASRSATTEFLRRGEVSATEPFRLRRLLTKPTSPPKTLSVSTDEKQVLDKISAKWLSWYNALFLLGAASGGLFFGWLGDTIGRVKAMAASIFAFSFFSLLAYWSATPEQLVLLRFLSGAGVGGMWPTGVALAAEAWSEGSRPMIAGMLGTAANVGLTLFHWFAYQRDVIPESWRWTLLICAAPLPLALMVYVGVPESRRWLAAKQSLATQGQRVTMATVFRPPLLSRTLIGIAVGTIPLLGGWGATQWVIPWADKINSERQQTAVVEVMESSANAGEAKKQTSITGPRAKAMAGMMRSGGATIGGLLGGWLASLLGRRLTYFLISISSLCLGEYIYLMLTPSDPSFWPMVFLLGVVSTLFFGLLPLYLPELFPTHARSTGAGVSFNFGRILTAVGVLAAGWITFALGDDYGRAGTITTLAFGVGAIVILFAPDTTKQKLSD
jgi:SHS family sialic acid transporter-like MFS transporter